MTGRHALGAVLALSLGILGVPLGCEGWNAPTILTTHTLPTQEPRGVELPEGVVDQIAGCVQQVTERGDPGKPLVRNMQFGVESAQDGRGGAVALEGATISDAALEGCIAGALRKMTVPVGELPLRVASSVPRRAPGAEARALDAFPLAAVLTASFNPAVIAVAGLMLTVAVVVYVVSTVHPSVSVGPTAVSMPTATAAPTAVPIPVPTAVPATTAVPTAVPTTTAVPKQRKRRYPNQTCENDELDALEAVKDKLCNKTKFPATCTGDRTRPTVVKKHDQIPC